MFSLKPFPQRALYLIRMFQLSLEMRMPLKPQSNEHRPPVLFCVFHQLCHPSSSCFPLTPSLLRALRTLIPITTQRAIRLSGQSPVHSAADGGQAECLELLLQKGYNVNALLDAHISGRALNKSKVYNKNGFCFFCFMVEFRV